MSNSASQCLHGLKILLGDDSKAIRRTAETLLSKEACQVFTVIDGFDALSTIAAQQRRIVRRNLQPDQLRKRAWL